MALTLDNVKAVLMVNNAAFDDEITGLMESAKIDLNIAGVQTLDDALANTAILTYCKMHFGNPSNYDRLRQSYNEQKAQMMMATGYTDWGDDS